MQPANIGSPRIQTIAVIGAGFGGLEFCKHFHSPQAEILLIDRTNHHLFQPLLYQVATAGLSAPEIAQPTRMIFAGHPRMTILMEEVQSVDLAARTLALQGQTRHWDYLVLAAGGVTSYFNHPEWERHAPGLKTLADAGRIRNDILEALEQAESETDTTQVKRLLTFVVVGGGPTGVEMAGAIAELTKRVMRRDFRHIDPTKARILLIEGGPRLLATFHPKLSDRALADLKKMGVEVQLHCRVNDVRPGAVHLENETVEAGVVIWAAGIRAAPLLDSLPAPRDRLGRVQVLPDCSIPGFPNAFVIGDSASLKDANGLAVPGVAQGAMQMGSYVAKIIAAEIAGAARGAPAPARPPFAYFDKGSMATIGRSRAVADIKGLRFGGFLAWMSWLGLHIAFLIGFRNRLAVLLQWFYSYVTFRRGARIIWQQKMDPLPKPPTPKS